MERERKNNGILLFIGICVSPWVLFAIMMLRRFKLNLLSKNTARLYPWLVAIILGSVGYCVCFPLYGDVRALVSVLERGSEFSYILQHNTQQSIGLLNFWFGIAVITRDYALITGVSDFIIFYVMARIFSGIVYRNQLNRYSIWILLFSIILLDPVSIVQTGRCLTAYSLFLLATYRDMVEKKRGFLTFFLYFIPICFHTSVVLLWFFRLIIPIYRRHKRTVLIMITFILFFFTRFAEYIKIPGEIGYYISAKNKLFSGGYYYGEMEWHDMHFMAYRVSHIFFLMVLLLFTYICYKKRRKKTDDDFISLLVLMAFFSLVLSITVHVSIYKRFLYLVMIGLPYYLCYLRSYLSSNNYRVLVSSFAFSFVLIKFTKILIEYSYLRYVPEHLISMLQFNPLMTFFETLDVLFKR